MGLFVREAAERMGISVYTATNAKEFWALMSDHKPDAIALDLVMPRTDGVEVIRQLGEAGCTSQIILISGYEGKYIDMARSIAAGKGLSVLGTLRKPVMLEDLQSMLGVLGEQKAAAAN